jgi:hypothetical protein
MRFVPASCMNIGMVNLCMIRPLSSGDQTTPVRLGIDIKHETRSFALKPHLKQTVAGLKNMLQRVASP